MMIRFHLDKDFDLQSSQKFKNMFIFYSLKTIYKK